MQVFYDKADLVHYSHTRIDFAAVTGFVKILKFGIDGLK